MCIRDSCSCLYTNGVRGPCDCESFSLFDHLSAQCQWSKETFGPGNRTEGVIDHIRKELTEIETSQPFPGADLSEWIDVIILALDGAWRVGFTPKDIIKELVAKQQKNTKRIWPDWRKAEPGKAIEHVREPVRDFDE